MKTSQALLLFPGQGSQYAGIGGDLYEASAAVRDIYARASEALGYDVHALSCGDSEDIHRTRFTQPVLLTHSVACVAALEEALGGAFHGRATDGLVATAGASPGHENTRDGTSLVQHLAAYSGGHSLGEYSALVAAGSLDFEDALRLVSRRGELMGTHGTGEMSALPLAMDEARALAEQHYCAIAGCNLPAQTVVGGRAEDVAAMEHTLQTRYPKKRAVRLKTEGAFHTYYMVKAAAEFRAVLEDVPMRVPTMRVLSNYSGGFHDSDVAGIKSKLFFQLFHPVRWHDNVQCALAQGITCVIEFGGGLGGDTSLSSADAPAGKRPNLEGLLKKATRGMAKVPAYHAVINLETLTATTQALQNAG